MENNKNKKSVKFQGDMLNFYGFIQVFVFTTNHHLKEHSCIIFFKIDALVKEGSHLKVFPIFSSGGHLFQRSGTV